MLLAKESVFLDIDLTEKKDVLSFIAMKAKELGVTQDDQQVLRDFLLREEEYTTAVQQGIAIPHAKSIAVIEPKLIFVKLKEKISWESDEFQVQVIFAILVPVENAGADYIKILSEIATNLLEEEFQEQIFSAKDEEEVLTIIKEFGKEKVE